MLRKDEPVALLEIKNARARALWTLRYFGGQRCPDFRTEDERRSFEAWYGWKLRRASRFLHGSYDR